MSETFADLPPEDFPFTVEFFRVDTHVVVHTVTVEGPGALQIPPLSKMHGVAIGVRVTYPDGRVEGSP